MDQLPNKLDFTPEIYKKTEVIQKEFDLYLDQVGELEAEIIDVFTGHSKSKDFVDHIMKRLEIDRDKANKIAAEVNKEIFGELRRYMREQLVSEEKSVSDLEQVGGFTIEKEPNQNSAIQNTAPVESRSEILAGIENPKPAPVVMTDPLVDHLLTTPTILPAQNSAPATAGTPESKLPTAPEKPKTPVPDPYHEPIS